MHQFCAAAHGAGCSVALTSWCQAIPAARDTILLWDWLKEIFCELELSLLLPQALCLDQTPEV